MKVLVTGTAGFIGSHVAQVLLARGDTVIGFDSLNDYYDVSLKQARLDRFIGHPDYVHVQADLADRAAVAQAFATHKPDRVINLAAQAGVRYVADLEGDDSAIGGLGLGSINDTGKRVSVPISIAARFDF